MKFKDQVKFVQQNLKRNRLRVFMTVLATTIGCAFLIVLASVGFGLHKSLTEEVLEQDIVTKISVFGKTEEDGTEQKLTKSDYEHLKEMNHVKALVEYKYIPDMLNVSMEDRTSSVHSTFVNISEWRKTDIELSEGRLPEKDNEIIVGYHFANELRTKEEREMLENSTNDDSTQTLGYTGSLVGKTVNMTFESEEPIPFSIVGVLDEPANEWAIDTSFYVSDAYFETVWESMQVEGTTDEIEKVTSKEVNLFVDNLENVEPVLDTLKEEGYFVYSVTEQLDGMNIFFLIFKIGLIFVGTIAVLIASIGIFNTMTMAVTERTQDIGIMKAIGAPPNVIRKIFLMESAWIGIIGAVFGVIISYGISVLCNWAIPLILNAIADTEGPNGFMFSYIPLSLVVTAFVISVGVAIISGFRPAIKATNISVLSALRKEI